MYSKFTFVEVYHRIYSQIFQLYGNMSVVIPILNRVPTSSGNHGKPGKSRKKVACMEKSWNLKKT